MNDMIGEGEESGKRLAKVKSLTDEELLRHRDLLRDSRNVVRVPALTMIEDEILRRKLDEPPDLRHEA